MTFVLPNKIAFVHIPKTGGTSVEGVLSSLGLSAIFGYHDTACSLQNRIKWEDHFSFAFIRNPWERALSIFLMRQRNTKPAIRWLSLLQFLRSPPAPDHWGVDYRTTQTSFICDGNNVELVNFLGRFEKLHKDWSIVAKKLDLPTELPHLNAGQSNDYRDHYNAEAKAIVARDHAEDIERFKYRFLES